MEEEAEGLDVEVVIVPAGEEALVVVEEEEEAFKCIISLSNRNKEGVGEIHLINNNSKGVAGEEAAAAAATVVAMGGNHFEEVVVVGEEVLEVVVVVGDLRGVARSTTRQETVDLFQSAVRSSRREIDSLERDER